MQPDNKKLNACVRDLAHAMKMNALPESLFYHLINHVLYDEKYDNIEGKNGWLCLEKGLLTEREMRNLFMAHSATKIARFNKALEPGCNTYATPELCNSFEYALFGRCVKLVSIDVLDPWEKNA